MIEAIDLCRELHEALESNSTIQRYTGEFTTMVDPTFFVRLKAVVQMADAAGKPNFGPARATVNAPLEYSAFPVPRSAFP